MFTANASDVLSSFSIFVLSAAVHAERLESRDVFSAYGLRAVSQSSRNMVSETCRDVGIAGGAHDISPMQR